MNKRGQTLILFVILIPILLGLCALVIDVGLIVSKSTHLKEVSKTIIEEVMPEASIEEIEDLFIKNDIPVSQLEVQIEDEKIRIQNEYEIDSIFGSVIGLSSYEIRAQITGIIREGTIIFE